MPARTITLDHLRRFAVGRSLFPPVGLEQAIDALGFVQADPIRAPARAQDLTLRHRVRRYRAGDLERRYATLRVEEDFFINYGFVSAAVHALMHPRGTAPDRSAQRRARVEQLIAFVREHGEVHPREVDAHFAHGTVVNYWGGSSSATTHLLDELHYRGLLRVTRRDKGIRVYAVRDPVILDSRSPRDRVDALVDVVVRKYAPLPASSLSRVVGRLRYAVPQWRRELPRALARAKARLAQARVDGVDWYWPEGERPESADVDGSVRLLAPFDPIVWDRPRFERLWNWAYRFEAYTPIARRKLGYYALPLLWRERVIGWGTVTVRDGRVQAAVGFAAARPRDARFRRELDAELGRLGEFLRLSAGPVVTTLSGPARV
jgi:uncharacterized protein